MKILITGGLGYLGSVVVEQLKNVGHEVIIADNNTYNLDTKEPYDKVDVVDIQKFYRDEWFDVVIALAGIVGDEACALDEDRTLAVNYNSVYDITKINTSRIIFASTCSVYGIGYGFMNEGSLCSPVSLYAHTKLEAERIILSSSSIKTKTIIRLPTLFGLSKRPRFDLVANLFVAQSYFDKKITVHGGRQQRPFCHVRDVAKGISMLLDASKEMTDYQIYNLGGVNYSILELARAVQNITNCEVKINEDSKDKRDYEVDFTKVKKIIGFEPKYTLYDSIEEHLNAFEEGKIENYKDPIYNNYLSLKESYGH